MRALNYFDHMVERTRIDETGTLRRRDPPNKKGYALMSNLADIAIEQVQ
jgi:hypothetical protein